MQDPIVLNLPVWGGGAEAAVLTPNQAAQCVTWELREPLAEALGVTGSI